MARFKRKTKLSRASAAFWVRTAAALGCVLVLAVSGWLEAQSHEDALSRSEQESVLLSSSLAQNADDTFQMADMALGALEHAIAQGASTPQQLGMISTDMAAMVERVPRLREIAYFDETGLQLATSKTFSTTTRNDSHRDYFLRHKRSPDRGLWIGHPIKIGSGKTWVITASRRFNKPDGRFGGVVLATINVGYFINFYTKFDTGNGLRINLTAFDGALLARYPRNERLLGSSYALTPAFKAMLYGPVAGTRRYVSPVDGAELLGAYTQLSGRPLLILVDANREAVLAPWRQGLLVRVPLAIALAISILLIGFRAARGAERRQAERVKLAELASVDALTGLANRRTFDATLLSEWREKGASEAPLSLLLIDIDRFKLFNDTYGHLAGDACLELVAAAVRGAAPVPHHHVARYGGEEIAVILPRLSPSAATAVGERIRASVEALAVPHRGSPDGILTVSIGVSSAETAAQRGANGPAGLIVAADQALYRSKALGRNRVSGPVPPLALIA